MEGENSKFELNAEGEGEPMKLFKKWRDMVTLALFQHKTSSVVLNTLETRKLVRGNAR